VLTVTTAAGMVVLAALAWRRRPAREAAWLAIALLAAAVWATAYSLEMAASTASARQAWGDAKYVGICALPPAWALFVSTYTGRTKWIRPWTMLLLAIEPTIVLVLLYNGHTHDLIRYYSAGSHVAKSGALFWPHSVYTYVLLWGATAVLVWRLSRLSPIYRRQSTVLVVSLIFPFACNLMFNLGIPPLDTVDLTPFAFLGAGVVLVWGVLRFRLAGLRPVARSQAFQRITDLVITLDPLTHVVDVNAAAEKALGQPAGRLVGRRIDSLLPRVDRVLDQSSGDPPVEERIGERTYDLSAAPLTDRRGRRLATLLVAHDITERKAVEMRLAHQALHDPLTGVANRTLFFERLSHALDHAARTGRSVAVLFLDLDLFKAINDQFGHAAGDQVLLEVVHRLRESVRKADTIARMGGDEFAVLLEDVVDEREATHVAAKLRESVRLPMTIDEQQIAITTSIGISIGTDLVPDEMIRRADERMYDAKRSRSRAGIMPRVPSQRRRRDRGRTPPA